MQGRNSPDAAEGPPSPCYSLLSQKPAVATQAQMNYTHMVIFSWEVL